MTIETDMKTTISLLLLISIYLLPQNLFALTTDEIIQLKNAGIPEEIIVLIVESNYKDTEKVLRLKEAGFKDESIKAIVAGEVKSNVVSEKIDFETTGQVKILWYFIYRDKPILQNSQTIENAKIALLDGSAVKIEWKEDGGLGLLEVLKKKAFKSPFYWVINKGDVLENGNRDYPLVLKTGLDHQGQPEIDRSHYWLVYLNPRDRNLSDRIKDLLH